VIVVREILGHVQDERFARRRIDRVVIGRADAGRSRLRTRTEAGTDVGIALPRGAYLAEGAVLADDGERIVVVERAPEEVAVVRLLAEAGCAALLADAVRLGHAFGNQHVPLEVTGDEVVIPVTTSRDVVAQTVRHLALTRAALSFDSRPFARERPPLTSLDEHGPHS
jgi:urease accessory protein